MHLSLESLISFDRIHSVAKDISLILFGIATKNLGNLIIFGAHDLFFFVVVESGLIETDRISFGKSV